jgi:hypothetical protein
MAFFAVTAMKTSNFTHAANHYIYSRKILHKHTPPTGSTKEEGERKGYYVYCDKMCVNTKILEGIKQYLKWNLHEKQYLN